MTSITIVRVLAVLVAATAQPAFCQAASLGAVEMDLHRDFSWKAIPAWQNGYFVGFEREPTHAPPVFAYDSEGNKLFEVPLALSDAVRIVPESMAASKDGLFAVSGSAYSASGMVVSFVAFLDRSGNISHVTRLSRFLARRLLFDAQGSLWAAGIGSNYPARGDPPDYDVLRVYGPEGDQKFSMLPSSSFPPGKTQPASKCHLTSNENQVLFMSEGRKELVGVSLEGKVLFRTHMEVPSTDTYVTGLALAPGGEIYMSCQVRFVPDQEFVGFYRWDMASRRWNEVYLRHSSEANGFHAIFGFDRDRMVVSTRLPRFKWISPATGFRSEPPH